MTAIFSAALQGTIQNLNYYGETELTASNNIYTVNLSADSALTAESFIQVSGTYSNEIQNISVKGTAAADEIFNNAINVTIDAGAVISEDKIIYNSVSGSEDLFEVSGLTGTENIFVDTDNKKITLTSANVGTENLSITNG